MNAGEVARAVAAGIGLDLQIAIPSTDPSVQQLLQFMHDTGKELATRAEWRGLFRTREFTAAANYVSLPLDYYGLVDEGGLVLDDTPVRMVRNAGTWEAVNAAYDSDQAPAYGFIDTDRIRFTKAFETKVVMRYVSTDWIVDGVERRKTMNAETNTFLVPWNALRLGTIYRWHRQGDQPYEDELAEYEAVIKSEYRSDRNILGVVETTTLANETN